MVFSGFKKNQTNANKSKDVLPPRAVALSETTLDDTGSIFSEDYGSPSSSKGSRTISEDHAVSLIAMLNGDVSVQLIRKRAEDLLESIRGVTRERIAEEKQVYKSMEDGLSLAKVRYTSGNTVGATVSMKKVQRHQERLLLIDEALDYLAAREEELAQQLHKLNEETDKMYGKEAHSFCVSLESELSRLESFAKHVDKILARDNHKERSDEKLLKALARQLA